jgi:hypothetical protein
VYKHGFLFSDAVGGVLLSPKTHHLLLCPASAFLRYILFVRILRERELIIDYNVTLFLIEIVKHLFNESFYCECILLITFSKDVQLINP